MMVVLLLLLLTGCTLPVSMHNPPCAEYDDPRPWCNPPKCDCDMPWAPQLDPCCKGLTTEVRCSPF